MDMVKCETCGKEFKSARALKIHAGRAHAVKKADVVLTFAKMGNAKKSNGKGKTRKAALICDVCGKTFGMAAHLARHMSTIHKAAKPKKGRKAAKKVGKIITSAAPVRRRQTIAVPTAAAASADVDVRAMTVDQLLTLKSDVDARLADIVKQMRAAKVAL